ncbi:MAG: hypothetical protein GC185_08365 [Alphaproteobacteria bacterium]|nr:hypothetical protein [Alphaproteobacteria bacterium]
MTQQTQSLRCMIGTEDAVLHGDLTLPESPCGLVIFAHGGGRKSPRNRYVAEVLNEHGLATLLADLLTAEEEAEDAVTRRLRFDIPLLAGRLETMVAWARGQANTAPLPVGLFGAGTGAAAALVAAARQADAVRAVVSRGGRPDLAMEFLPLVKAPALLIVGERDTEALALNRRALEKLGDASRLDIVPRATHLFEEPGALENAAKISAMWFLTQLADERQENAATL